LVCLFIFSTFFLFIFNTKELSSVFFLFVFAALIDSVFHLSVWRSNGLFLWTRPVFQLHTLIVYKFRRRNEREEKKSTLIDWKNPTSRFCWKEETNSLQNTVFFTSFCSFRHWFFFVQKLCVCQNFDSCKFYGLGKFWVFRDKIFV
jgi:hypothetical protein